MSLYDQGRLVTTERATLYTIVAGNGAPTVIFDAGLSNDAEVWYAVAPAITAMTSVCLYDRANVGRSAKQPTPRTSQDVVDDMHALLTRMVLPEPYILVGHSFSGSTMRLYAAQHSERIAALVLVDAPAIGRTSPIVPCSLLPHGKRISSSGTQKASISPQAPARSRAH